MQPPVRLIYQSDGFFRALPPFGPVPSHLFFKPLNWLDFDPTYPKNLKTFGKYIRKHRMEQGLLIREFAEQLGVTEDTVINWEKSGRRPQFKSHIHSLRRIIPEVATFLSR